MLTRPELDILTSMGLHFDQTWQISDYFERQIAGFFGAAYAVATDSGTHALELCCRLYSNQQQVVSVPLHTYISVPMMLDKIGQPWGFCHTTWQDQYVLDPWPIIDGARLWKRNSYLANTLLALSFQFKKHIPIGRGGMILTDNEQIYNRLQRMVHDGRDRRLLWQDDDITDLGYHYYMTPEDAARGIILFEQVKDLPPVSYGWKDYKPLTDFSYFKSHRGG